MGSIINENIRYYKANDPYYFEVDNLPLQDLVENDKNLEDAVLAISGGTSLKGLKEIAQKIKSKLIKWRTPKGSAATAVGRESIDDLLPYVSGTDGKIYVSPGIFSARTSKSKPYHDGSYEQEESTQSVSVGTPLSENRLKNQEFNTPGRIEIFQLIANAAGEDPSIAVPQFRVEDWDYTTAGNPEYRIDLVGVAGDNEPFLFLIEGAGFASTSFVGTRFDMTGIHTGGITAEPWNNDPTSVLHDTPGNVGTGKLDWGTGTKKKGSFPLPDDLFNSAPRIINNAIGDTNNQGFGVALAYILVPTGYLENTALGDSNIMDIRPLFRSAELTLTERQGIVMADPPASNSNPFVTQAVTKALDARIDSTLDAISGLSGDLGDLVDNDTITYDYDIFGKIMVQAAMGNGKKTYETTLGKGRYLVFVVCSINLPSSWPNQGSFAYKVKNIVTGGTMPSAFPNATDNATSYQAQHDGDGGAPIMLSITVETPFTVVHTEVYSTASFSASMKHVYYVKIGNE